MALLLLGLHALAHHVPPAPAPASRGGVGDVPAAVRGGGSVIDARADPAVALRPPDGTLALTFEDGPDPVWTPRILDVLEAHEVRATFFVTGARAARHPGLVREIAARGHEIGGHTATHGDLREAGELRTSLELRGTDAALGGAAGLATTLVRPPYPAVPELMDDAAWRAAERIGAEGKLIVLSNLDSGDRGQPGVERIVAASTPRGSEGVVLRMHDGGGERAQTVAALDRLLPWLRAGGWTVTTVGSAMGLPGERAEAPAHLVVGGWLLVGAVQVAGIFAALLDVVLVLVCALAGLRLVLAAVACRPRRTRARARAPRFAEPVTVIVPARNERERIAETVRSALAARHPVRVLVVDDGSTDGTADVVEALGLPRVRAIRQAWAGRAAALNTGLAAAGTDVVLLLDAGTVLDPDAVPRLVRYFAVPGVGAVSGAAHPTGPGGMLGGWQHLEYVAGFGLDRRMSGLLGCVPPAPGGASAFRRAAVQRLGGVPAGTLTEDADLMMTLQRAGWRVVHEPRAAASTAVPGTLGALWRQRHRWCHGTLQTVWKHRRALFGSGSAGRLGRRGLPYLLATRVVQPVLAPLADLAAVFGLLTGDGVAPLLWLGVLAARAATAALAFRMAGERARPLALVPLEHLLYRPLLSLVVVQSLVTALAGVRLPRHRMRRSRAPVARHP
ncbi:cellulose synthase/poly-beta-1,6-N-acetylglucosamine synthase-like glycosyltransferase [Prauserella muralis]|nr:cellulose synthase/poly-beta-1,6-N-acetylglucosamine synthase-like glycosyltransferase [Prauserella muralis]